MKNVYGKKGYEDGKAVCYSYGCNSNNLIGEFKLLKDNMTLVKMKDSNDRFKDIPLFRIAKRIDSIFEKTGEFPDEVACESE